MAPNGAGLLKVKVIWSQEARVILRVKISGVITVYRLHSELVRSFKLVCLSKPVKVTGNRNDTDLLQKLSIFRKLGILNVL